jgi:hypothetical protein
LRDVEVSRPSQTIGWSQNHRHREVTGHKSCHPSLWAASIRVACKQQHTPHLLRAGEHVKLHSTLQVHRKLINLASKSLKSICESKELVDGADFNSAVCAVLCCLVVPFTLAVSCGQRNAFTSPNSFSFWFMLLFYAAAGNPMPFCRRARHAGSKNDEFQHPCLTFDACNALDQRRCINISVILRTGADTTTPFDCNKHDSKARPEKQSCVIFKLIT